MIVYGSRMYLWRIEGKKHKTLADSHNPLNSTVIWQPAVLANQRGVNTDLEVSDLPCPLCVCTLITRRSDCSYSVREELGCPSLRNSLKLRDSFNWRADTVM